MQGTLVEPVSPALAELLVGATRYAGDQLGSFVERHVELRSTAVERVRLEQLNSFLDGVERLVTAVYLAFWGDLAGHVVLVFAPTMAAHLASTLLMSPRDGNGALSALEISALGEVGNITAASFLTSVAQGASLVVYPSPPVVVQDMVGALLDSVILEMAMESSYALVLHTSLAIDGEGVDGQLILLPSSASCGKLEGYLAA